MAGKILVVDDDPDTLDSIKDILVHEGFVVETAISAERCLVRVKKTKYDLILIDIYMPGMSGEKLFRVLRKTINHKTPLAYVTIKPKVEIDLKDIEGFVQKPFETSKLVSEVKRILNDFKSKKTKK